ncbi:BREX system Lon protease-like protein BrxL [Candidatus Thiodictyon syntrophicum]|jgi:uncharacterized protein (TIGR02688 family)|uniref:TIGR02688 family protein n=1 Tax=Candidatus Thiodictyon syntrophicum TaxID=1166950 RepID=A0A2K8UA51_9GAMM|nr:BREX system Lon protease-like protein BrxL [Candidatus Thiodictyon syntrophicum]AUB81931.1 TIGR02688 family protein [Candidatus Thiodictyon syntrophicum]
MQLDALDQLAAQAFDGFIVRKDLVRRFKGQYPVPTYVGEFLLGRYCSSTNEAEIQEGLDIVQRQLASRTVRAGEEELFKARAKEQGRVKLIDLITARLDAKNDCFVAELPSLRLKEVRIDDALVHTHERMLTGGFYAELDLSYDPSIAEEKNGRPFGIESLREIQLSKRDALETMARGRAAFSFEQWQAFLLRSVGLEPENLSPRTRDVMLLRMVPFVENNYNAVELGPRGTGKSHLFQQVSPYAHLVSGGKASVARMFVNNSTGQRGLVCQYDVVCFDEVSGISFDQKDGVNIMKGYMESGEFSRGKESIRGFGSIVMVGNFEVDVVHQQRVGHLFGPMPPEMRDDTAFMDRIHAYMPGWDIPKVNRDQLTDHFGQRIGSAEFRNTHFSFQMGLDGVEQFVSTPELQSEDSIGDDPLPPGQVWVLSPGGLEEHPGLYRLDVTQGPGSGVKILNQPPPAPFKESLRCAEQNLYTRAKNLVGDRDPRAHEFSVQLRAFDAGKSGSATGVGALLALCSALLEKSLKGGLIVVGGLNLGGSIEPVYNVVSVVEAAADKGAKTILLPVTTRKQLIELDDEIATRVTVVFYSDARDALLKALIE